MSRPNAPFGELLRLRRQRCGLTQANLAERAGLSVRAVSDLERGLKKTPRQATLQLLIEALQLDASDAAAFLASARGRRRAAAPGVRRDNLPVALTSLVGRERDSADVAEALASARLVTLVGTGGIGKTRLALEVARAVSERYRNGVWLAELASLADAQLVVQEVATVLDIREQPGRPILNALLDGLRNRELLLVVDNCEHLKSSCADLVHAVLRTCPNVRVLATSREPLHVPGEVVWRVAPLDVPDPHATDPQAVLESAVGELFVTRARAAQPHFAPDAEDSVEIGRICRALDGLPLAVELAAALVRILSPKDIAARLEDRFNLLQSSTNRPGSRDETLRTAIAWGYSVIAESEQHLFDQLSVFPGGWSMESAQAVCNGAFRTPASLVHAMTRLVDTSLIVADEHGNGRFRMLETLRQFGQEQLALRDASDLDRMRHALYFAELGDRAEVEIFGADQLGWHRLMELEQDNFRAALRWASEIQDGQMLLRLATGAAWFWMVRGQWSEGRRWLDLALSMAASTIDRRVGQALFVCGAFAWLLGDLGASRQRGEACLRVAEELNDDGLRSRALINLGTLEQIRGDSVSAHRSLERSLRCARAAGDRWAQGRALDMLGAGALQAGNLDAAAAYLDESMQISRAAEDAWSLCISLNARGDVARMQGEVIRATRLYQESLELSRALKFGGVGIMLSNLGHLAHQGDDDRRAASLFGEALNLLRVHASEGDLAGCLVGVAGACLGLGEPEAAARLFGTAEALLDSLDRALWPSNVLAYQKDRATALRTLGEDRFELLRSAGAAVTADRAVDFALETLEAAPGGLRSRSTEVAGGSNLGDLTAREREVVRLVLRGMTNREIANELMMAPKTAINHVAHALDKLGVTSRVQLLARAGDLGLDSLRG